MRRSFAWLTFTTALSTLPLAAHAQTSPPTPPLAPASQTGQVQQVPSNRSVDVQATTPAQTPDVANAEPQSGGLQDIIVTATRRNENLQNVPVSVSAISSTDLKSQGVFETSDLNHAIPNLQVSSPYGKQQPNFSVRGVGVGTEFNANAASPVGVYVDEVYQGFRNSHGQQLYDLNQIEVVRGPQGTLYGRNTTGGAINFITNAPTLHGERGYMTVGYGTYNRFNMEGAVEVTPVEDKLGIRLAGTYVDSDPYVHNIQAAGLNTTVAGGASGLNRFSGIQPGGYQSYGLRLTIRFKPVDAVDLSLKVYGGESKGGTESPIPIGSTKGSDVVNFTNPNFLLGGLFSALAPAGLVPSSYSNSAQGGSDTAVRDDTESKAQNQARGVVFNAKIKFSDYLRLISITGYDDASYSQLPTTDCDGTPLRLCAIGYHTTFNAFNEDTRLDFAKGKVKLIVGGYYGRDEVISDNQPDFFNFLSDVRAAVGLPATFFNPGGAFNGTALSAGSLPTGIRAQEHFKQIRTSAAAYGEGSFQLTDTIKLTAGLRYTSDKIRYLDGLTTYFDDAGVARLITVSNYMQGGAYAPYFLQPVRNEAGAIAIPSFQSLGIPLPGGLNQRGGSNRLSGRAIVDWKPVENIMFYGSYSRGYRAGTFNGLAYGSANQVYFVKPETVNAYEVGFKTRFIDNRLQINGSLFYYDYKGQQGQVVDATATANLISLNGKLKGLDLDMQFALTRHLRLSGALGILDSRYDDGACPSNSALIPKFPAQLGSCVVSSAGPVSVAGNPFPYAAKESGNAAVDWDAFDDGNNKLTFHGDVAYTGRFYYDSFKDYSRAPLNKVSTGDFGNGEGNYWIANARVGFTHGQYSIAGWVKNLTNKTYYPFGISLENLFGVGYRVRAEPRTAGAELTFRW